MTEFTVRLANRPGQLAALAELLAGAGVNIEALAAFGLDEEGHVRLVVNDTVAARRVLSENGFAIEEREVLTIVLPDRPGTMAETARSLADAGVNIEAAYLLRSRPEGLEFAIAVDEIESARERLS